MERRYGNLNYGQLTKYGVLGGGLLFLAGFLGEVTLRSTGGLTPTLDTTFVTLEFVGPLVVILSLAVFGVVLPLTE